MAATVRSNRSVWWNTAAKTWDSRTEKACRLERS